MCTVSRLNKKHMHCYHSILLFLLLLCTSSSVSKVAYWPQIATTKLDRKLNFFVGHAFLDQQNITDKG